MRLLSVNLWRAATAFSSAIALTAAGTLVVAARADAAPPSPCGPTTCTASFGFTGGAQTFTVPGGVTALTFGVVGAEGGASYFSTPGGGGGSVTGTLPVVPGQSLTLVVGQAGSVGGGGNYGGGGASGGSNFLLGSGGGGSFLFAPSGAVLVAAGGGGGGGGISALCGYYVNQVGGFGSGAQSTAGASAGGCYYAETMATGASAGGPGVGGTNPDGYGNGASGTGPADAFLPGAGGAGGDVVDSSYAGGGGGGGYYGGGGGGYSQSGAGGSGFATASITDATSQSGANFGNGSIVLTWPAQLATVALTVSPQPGGNPGDADTMSATVSGATATPTGTVTFTVDGNVLSDCAPQPMTSGLASCTTTSLTPGDHSIEAQYSGDATYSPANSQDSSYEVPSAPSVTTTSLPTGTVNSPYSVVLSATGGVAPYTWTLTSGTLPDGLALSTAGLLHGSPTSATDGAPLIVTATDSQQRPITASQALTLVIVKVSQTVTFTSTAPTSAKVGDNYSVVTTGGDSGNPVVLSVDGASAAICSVNGDVVHFDHAGDCTVVADQAGDGTYATGQATQTVAVGPRTGAITFTSSPPDAAVVDGTYGVTTDGSGSSEPVVLSVAVASTGLCSLAGSTVTFLHAGDCTVVADQAGDADITTAQATQTVTVGPRAGAITFSSSAPDAPAVGGTYVVTTIGSGSSEPVVLSIAVGSTGLCSLAGSTVTFLHIGDCTVVADQAGDADITTAQATQTVTVGPRTGAITFSSSAPDAPVVGGTYVVTTIGSGSSEPVVLSIAVGSTGLCSLAGSTVTFLHAGDCTVVADQAGDADTTTAHATQSMVVALRPSVTTVALDDASAVTGQPVQPTATVADGTAVAGSVQFAVDGSSVGVPVMLVDGTAVGPFVIAAVGNHTVSAIFTPTDDQADAPSTGSTALLISPAATLTAVTVAPGSLNATVAPVAPGAGAPTGTVQFRVDGQLVGSASVTGGVASLTFTVPSGASRVVSALYSGDAGFLGSAGSTARHDPVITAVRTSRMKRSAAGWYRSAVRVTFTCATAGAPLTAPCPSAAVLTGNGAAQRVKRTITATDGGIASISVLVNIDRTAPTVLTRGIINGRRYFGTTPRVRCVGRDALSGLQSCAVALTRSGRPRSYVVSYVVTAVDWAGNRSSTRGRYTMTRLVLIGAQPSHRAYTVPIRTTVQLQYTGSMRPRYLYAAPASGSPSGISMRFPFHAAGNTAAGPTWVLAVTVTNAFRIHRYWNIGVEVGHRILVLHIRVTHP